MEKKKGSIIISKLLFIKQINKYKKKELVSIQNKYFIL